MFYCVDGGGTRTRGRLYTTDGRQLAYAEAGPCNVSTDPILAAENVTAAFSLCLAQAGLKETPPHAVLASISAAGTSPRKKCRSFLAHLPTFADTIISTDGYGALVGASGGTPCVLIITGTGTAGHRLYGDGTSIRRDGWGWIAGDRGSGVWMGRKALRHAMAVSDRVEAASALSELIYARLRTLSEFVDGLAGISPHVIGSYAPLVFEAAEAGDAVARRIIDGAIAHLVRLAGVLDLADDIPLYITGGLSGRLGPSLADALRHEISAPAADALHGSYLIASGVAPRENVSLSPDFDIGIM